MGFNLRKFFSVRTLRKVLTYEDIREWVLSGSAPVEELLLIHAAVQDAIQHTTGLKWRFKELDQPMAWGAEAHGPEDDGA